MSKNKVFGKVVKLNYNFVFQMEAKGLFPYLKEGIAATYSAAVVLMRDLKALYRMAGFYLLFSSEYRMT